MKISLTYLGTRNSKFRLNLTQRVTGSLVSFNVQKSNKTAGEIKMYNTLMLNPKCNSNFTYTKEVTN